MSKVIASSLVLALGTINAVPVFAYSKDETVYTKANANGSSYQTIVSEHLKNSDNAELLKDMSTLLNIKNTNGDEEASQNGTSLEWKTSGNDIYYQGNTDKELPLDCTIKYELNGEEIAPNDLIGKSGSVKITIEYTNKEERFVNINGKKYAIQNFIVRDCLIKFYQDAEIFNFNSNNSFVKDFELSSSTLYNLSEASNGRFMRVAGGKGADVGWADCSMNFTSNTFYNISCDQEAFNSNVWNRQKNTVNLSKNIFYDSCKGEFNRRIVGGRTDNAKTCDNNCYWYKGGSGLEKEANGNYGDKSTSAYGVDPGFKDPANGDFTVRHSEVISHGSGDPRWLK